MITVVPSYLNGKITISGQKTCMWTIAANAVGCRIEALNTDSFIPDKNIFDFIEFLQSTGVTTKFNKTKIPEVYYNAALCGNEFYADKIESFILIALVILSLTKGESRINNIKKLSLTTRDKLYRTIGNLKKMGADISVKGRRATVNGVNRLHGAKVFANDLRGGSALVLAGLNAEGVSEIYGVNHIKRGYLNIDEKLRTLGANVKLQKE